MLRYLLLVLTLILGACSSSPSQPSNPTFPPTPPMAVAPGASQAQVEAALRTAIQQASHGDFMGSWAVEDSQPGHMIVGLHVRQHYLQLTLDYDAHQVTSRITGSQNLNQHGTAIHHKAFGWQRRLNTYIYRDISQIHP